MTPEKMAEDAKQAIADGTNMTMVMQPGTTRKLPGFPRGELICENPGNRNVYRFDPERVLNWLSRNRLINETPLND